MPQASSKRDTLMPLFRTPEKNPIMTAPRKMSEQPDHDQRPVCPGCHDASFVKEEQVITGETVISFWTCTSCLRSWPAPAPRMAKADLKRYR
jgi:hypothetical protein